MGPVKQTNGASVAPVELLRYLTPHSVGFDIAQLLRMAARDDGTREGGNSAKILTKDINGNPAETEGSQQMREALPLDDKSCVVSVSGKPGSSGSHNHEMGHTQGEDLAGSQSSSSSRRVRRNKRTARQQGIEVHPDQDESYVGNVSNIDDLVKYINNDISAENLKGIDGGVKVSNGNGLPAGSVKVTKRKERNKVKTVLETSGTGGTSDVSDTQCTSLSENTLSKPTEPQEPASNLHEKKPEDMGNLSSSEKLDTKENEIHSSSSVALITDPETSKQKTPKSEVVKHEPEKNQKNHLMSNGKTLPNTKQAKNNDDKASIKNNVKETDAEDAKAKSSKKGKSKSMKKEPQKEVKKRGTSPSPPVTPEIPLDVTGSPQEQWCTVVSKPQKKKRSQAQLSATVQNFSTAVVTHQTHSKELQISSPPYPYDPRCRSQQYGTSQQQCIQLASHPMPYLRTSESEDKEKDLSPSDFPVLNSSPRDCRRSLENVFDTGALNIDRDSDKESSKSFPADLGLGDRCRTRYPVSYATMASGNTAHESVDSSKAESVSSSVEESSVEFSAKSAALKWKGSPQERRHSIGSAPKELSKNVLQRTGSQETLHSDKDLRSQVISIPKNNPNCENFVSSDSTASFTSSDADSARGSDIGSEGIGEEFTTAPASVAIHSGTSVETTASSGEVNGIVNSESETTKSIPVESAHGSQSIRTETKMTSSGAKSVNNGRKKGVVFFCHKNEEYTPISGLHFGFFHEEEYASLVTNPALNKPSVPMTNGDKVLRSAPEDSSCSSSSPTSQQPPAFTDAASSNSISSETAPKPPKGPHIAGLNGLVLSQITDSSPATVLHTSAKPLVISEQTKLQSTIAPLNSESASNTSLEDSEVSSEAVEVTENKITFTYGAQLKNKPLKYAVYVRPPEEISTYQPSQDMILSRNYLGAAWKWNNNHWEVIKTDM